MEMSNTTLILILSAVISLLISYYIITYAVKEATAELRQHAKIQTDLLTHMARRAGVTEQEIQDSFNK